MRRILAADIECFSDVDLIKCGVYAYADSPAFEILLFAYSFDGGETQIIDLAQGEKLPAEVEDAIFDVSVTKTAYNANFERTCLSMYAYGLCGKCSRKRSEWNFAVYNT